MGYPLGAIQLSTGARKKTYTEEVGSGTQFWYLLDAQLSCPPHNLLPTPQPSDLVFAVDLELTGREVPAEYSTALANQSVGSWSKLGVCPSNGALGTLLWRLNSGHMSLNLHARDKYGNGKLSCGFREVHMPFPADEIRGRREGRSFESLALLWSGQQD